MPIQPTPIKDIRSSNQPADPQPTSPPQPSAVDQTPQMDSADPPETTKTEESGDSIGLAVGIAVVIALVLVVIGVLAYRNADLATELEDESATSDTDTNTSGEMTAEQLEGEFDAFTTDLDELEGQDDIDAADLSDANLLES